MSVSWQNPVLLALGIAVLLAIGYIVRAKDKTAAGTVLAGIAGVMSFVGGTALVVVRWPDSTDQASSTPTGIATTTVPESPDGPVDATDEVMAREPPHPDPPPADLAVDALDRSTLMEGQGRGADSGDTVTFHYVCVLPDGSVVGRTWDLPERPQRVTLGGSGNFPAWDEGLRGAKVGERLRLEVGTNNAYGVEGAPNGVMSSESPLAFVVDIMKVERGN